MTKARKSPAMPLYGKDAWTDEEFAASPWDFQGLFWRLAFWQWMEGSIPADVNKIVEVVGKPRETRRLFAKIQELRLFIPHPNESGRLYNMTTHGHRESMLEDRAKRQLGADKTNTAQRTAQRTGERDAQRVAIERDASRAADANAVVSGEINKQPGSAEGAALTPQQQAVKTVIDALEAHTTDFLLPTGGLVARWVKEFGIDLITATIRDEGVKGTLDGKSPSYLHQCIESRKRRPHGITTGSRTDRRATPAKASTGESKGRSARDFGDQDWRSVRVEGDGKVPPLPGDVAGGPNGDLR